jgi:hypothetical protein
LDDNLPSLRSQSNSERCHQTPRTNLGVLDTLPPELLQEILYQVDLRTLTDFRKVNRRATELVDSLPQYRAVNTYALNALHGIFSIKTGRWITCTTLYEKLCTFGCEQCGDFGGYLYLLTCRRVCFLCFSQDKRFLPLSPRRASMKFGLNSKIINTLPRMRAIVGIYSPNEKKVKTPSILVDYESALRSGMELHGSSDAMNRYVADREVEKLQSYNVRVAAMQQSGSTACRIRQPRTSDPFDGQSGNAFRYVAIVRLPWLRAISHEVEWGFHCAGCEKSSRPPLHYRRKFTADSFNDHLEQFGNIRDGKHHHAGNGV